MIKSITQSDTKKAINKVLIIGIWILIWYVASVIVGSEFLFPSPMNVLKRLFQLAQTEEFWKSCAMSLLRITAGCLSGIIAGFLFGVITAFSSRLNNFFSPMLTVIKTTPVASFIILLLVWLKRSEITIVVSMLLVIPVIWNNVSQGIITTNRKMIEMSKTFRFNKAKVCRYIYLPNIYPFFKSGCITSIGFSWKAGISAEVIANPMFSIGTALYKSKLNLEYTDLFAWTVAVIVLSVLIEKTVKTILYRGAKNGHSA